ncbi:fibropellin-1-like [Saccostrea cucullata]|uniref:fibropellin-1-like n=1 Tax=Saccostrea cuccullata TaxID=36930 RepID=UPI002ED66794
MNRKLIFVIFVLAAFLVLAGSGRRRRRRRNCPRTDEDSNGDHWCCDVITKNETHWDLFWWPCDEIDALQEDYGDEHPSEEEWNWCGTDGSDRRRRSSGRSWYNLCPLWVAYNVTVNYNIWSCCPGWNEDVYGYCSIAESGTGPLYCDNGGSLIDNSCVCLDGFIGTHCETPVCKPDCQNNGHCAARDGKPICVCPENFGGDQCQTPICEKPCLNGGLCVADACETRCRCKAGYAGKFCEIVIKEGDCPINMPSNTCGQGCSTDNDCAGVNKCCYHQSCGFNECMKPINSSRCVYQNHTYNVGEQMKKDDCTTCICQGEGMSYDPSGFDCYTIDCFVTSCPDGMVYRNIPGQCCGQCEAIKCPTSCGQGHCDLVYGNPQCICPANFRGTSCDTPVCDKPCLNGGTCIAGGTSNVCLCGPAYTGRHCETRIPDKEGICPRVGSSHLCGNSCNSDWQCAGSEKCCLTSCGQVCVPPLNPHICIHENMTYGIDTMITKDNCTTCICKGQGNAEEPSGFACRETPCPLMMGCAPGYSYKKLPGECCARCVAIECQQPCQHGGDCRLHQGSPKCICSEYFQGEFCEIARCPVPCQNGGRCVANGDRDVMCACPVGFSGKYCESKVGEKKGICPSTKGSVGICAEMCSHDLQCPGDNKCCSNGCGHECSVPLDPNICKVGNVTYRKGEQIQKSVCQNCVCMGQGHGYDASGFKCTVTDCPQIMCAPGFEYKASKERCCPYCEEIPVPPPKFQRCPAQITLEVNSYDRLVDLQKYLLPKLQVIDGWGQVLEVSLSALQLEHCMCPQSQRNIHNVVAKSKPDKYGRIATCAMAVKVKDVHPPVFASCPSNIELFTTESVMWDRPTVNDNVGIGSIDFLGSRGNNTKFPSGNYLLGYIARDFEGNVAVCQFKVSVWEKDSTDISMPHQMKRVQEETAEGNKMFIGIGAALGALITIGVVVVLYICCRRSAAARAANNRTRSPSASFNNGFDNGIYAIYGASPPEYEVPGKGKLPEYSASDPPEYESIDPHPQKSYGVENMAYVSTIDVKMEFDNKFNENASEKN